MVEKAEGLLELALKRVHEGEKEYDPAADEKRKFWKPSDVLKTETEERFDDTKKTFTDKWSRETFVKKNAAKKTTKKADDDDDFDFDDLDDMPDDAAPAAGGGGEGAAASEAPAAGEAPAASEPEGGQA